jgi:hypothetical protein
MMIFETALAGREISSSANAKPRPRLPPVIKKVAMISTILGDDFEIKFLEFESQRKPRESEVILVR